jgi:lysophospholipase L1-like esterase
VKLQKNDKLVMIGDSITDAGRAQPIGEGLFGALGTGYVAQVDALLGVCYPHLGVRIVNVGTSGNRVRDLKPRWQRDVLDLKADWVSCMIGTNDVWRQFDSPKQTEIHVPLDEYRETLDELVVQTLSGDTPLKGLILMTPFYIEPNKRDAMRATMDRYGAAVKKIAAKRGVVFVDTQAAFDEMLKHYYAATLAWDRVHPTQTGHMVIARAFLNALGFRWA